MAKVRLYWRGSKAYLDWAEGGERFRRSIGQPDAREAERIRAAKEAELTHGVRILARLPKVRDYLEWYLDWYEAEHPTTISKARSEVKRFIERFGHRPIDSIRAVEVEQYKRARLLDDKAAKETVGKEIRRLKAAFNRGVEWKELDVNPLSSVKAPRGVRSVAVKFYDRAAMRRLYRANPARAPLWLFMAHTGLRRGEIIGLEKALSWPAAFWWRAIRTRTAKAGPSQGSGARFPSTATPGGRYVAYLTHWLRCTRTLCPTGSIRIRSWRALVDTFIGLGIHSARTW